MIDKVFEFALRAHKGQVDKSGQPYLLHPIRVASKFQGDELLYTVALLHDVVEDTFGTDRQIDIDEVQDTFGGIVAQAVDALTRREVGMRHIIFVDEEDGYHTEIVESVNKEVYLTEFIPRLNSNVIAIYVKIQDIYDNLDPSRLVCLTEDELGRIKRYHKALKILLDKHP